MLGLPITSSLFIVVYIILSSSLVNYKPIEFDQELWINHDKFYINRAYYIEDLIINKKINGKCYEEIIDYLGKPNISLDNTLEYKFLTGKLKIILRDSCCHKVKVECDKNITATDK